MKATELPFIITRTRSKGYIGQCQVPDDQGVQCGWTTDRIRNRVDASLRLRDHCRRTHGVEAEPLVEREVNMAIKQPTKELPEQDNEKLGDYRDHLVVMMDAKPGSRDTSFGKRKTMECLVYVFLPTGVWKSLGDTPVFYATVQKQLLEAGDEPLAGVLRQGTDRNDREWFLAPTKDAKHTRALRDFDADKIEPF